MPAEDICKKPALASNESSRTSHDVVAALAYWHTLFQPHELMFVFVIDRHWSMLDACRDRHIANALRVSLETNHSDASVKTLLRFFHSRPGIQLLPRPMIDALSRSNSEFIHLIPFINRCPLCKRNLGAYDSRRRRVYIVCEQGKVLAGA